MRKTRMVFIGKILAALLAGLSLAWCGIRWGNIRTFPSNLRSSTQNGLSDCPDSPNCVSTSATLPANRIAPIELQEALSDATNKLESIIKQMPGSRIIVSQGNYLHAEFRSRFFGFVDDLEILVDEDQKLILIRSASRIGYSDLGMNRKRCEEIRRLYAARSQ